LWWNEKQFKPDGTMKTMTKWKICDKCHKQLFADELNFGQNMDGTWKDTCKDWVQLEKIEKEKRREERRARRAAKENSK
jgi:hypothetical protein